MPRYKSKINEFEVIWFNQNIIDHYNKHVSKVILDKFGKGIFSDFEATNEILFFLNDGFINQMKCFLASERSLAFYQYIQILHDYTNEIVMQDNFQEHFDQITPTQFALYRRILRFILEQSTYIELIFAESLENCKERVLNFLEELIHVGYRLFNISNLITSQQLIEDAVEIFFNDDDLYVIDYKHHYNTIIDLINQQSRSHLEKAVKDENASEDFANAMMKCFGISFKDVNREVKSMHQHQIDNDNDNEPYPCAGGFDLHSLVDNLSHNSNVSYEIAEKIISGLIVSKDNVCSFQESVYKPQSINRHLYRPIIQYKIEGIDQPMTIVSFSSLIISLQQLATNAISWGKYPEEWKDECFDEYVKNKKHLNDKILEDHHENLLKENNITYSRNIKNLKRKNNQNLNIDNSDCGEIDFLILKDTTIYIADSKHLLARYDFNNWKNDFSAFETHKKNYNETMDRKIKFLSDKKELIQEHFETENPGLNLDLSSNDIEGIFLINASTFYMYNSTYKLLTVRDFELFLKGEFVYPTFYITEESGEGTKEIIVSHPYFKKPEYIIFEEEKLCITSGHDVCWAIATAAAYRQDVIFNKHLFLD